MASSIGVKGLILNMDPVPSHKEPSYFRAVMRQVKNFIIGLSKVIANGEVVLFYLWPVL